LLVVLVVVETLVAVVVQGVIVHQRVLAVVVHQQNQKLELHLVFLTQLPLAGVVLVQQVEVLLEQTVQILF
jgi:mRNA-degrading endonuclease toxin of MazEF toxin-antitoxin module